MNARAGHRGDGTVRRSLDVTVSAAALCLAIGLAVLLVAGRPVLFRQSRCGRDGVEFTILKFRTMRPADWPGQPDHDRRIALGTALRSTSLDELPQLINILRGDMSVIGPRPAFPEQVWRYTARERRRLVVRPGLTGWAQVHGRNALSWAERIGLRITLRTIAMLVRPRGINGAGVPDGYAPPVPADEDARHAG